jgi:hypothetical protein
MARFQQVMAAERAHSVYLVHGDAGTDGRRAWYYLQIEPAKRVLFEKRMGEGELDVSAYGAVLYSGYGEQPPKCIAAWVAEDFGQAEKPA